MFHGSDIYMIHIAPLRAYLLSYVSRTSLLSPPPIQMFVRGRPLEVTIPEGAGGGATMRIRLPRAATTEESAELEEPEGPD